MQFWCIFFYFQRFHENCNDNITVCTFNFRNTVSDKVIQLASYLTSAINYEELELHTCTELSQIQEYFIKNNINFILKNNNNFMTLPKTQSEHKSDIQFIFIGDDSLV